MGRRARGLALLGAAVACAGLAASSVSRYANDVSAQVGPLATAVVARVAAPRGRAITARWAAGALEERSVPRRYVPPGALASPRQAIGRRLAVPLQPGDYVTSAALDPSGGSSKPAVQPGGGGRLVEIPVAGAGSIAAALHVGSRVDVLITTNGGAGGPSRTYLALQAADLVDFRPPESGDGGKATATLRVTLRQAVLLTAAENFARELRLVPRPGGDSSRLGPVAVSAGRLGL